MNLTKLAGYLMLMRTRCVMCCMRLDLKMVYSPCIMSGAPPDELKIRGKVYGISDPLLILHDSWPSNVHPIFPIHDSPLDSPLLPFRLPFRLVRVRKAILAKMNSCTSQATTSLPLSKDEFDLVFKGIATFDESRKAKYAGSPHHPKML